MEKRNLTCICCPIGCQIEVTLENGNVTDVTGNTCKRGDAYARTETVAPVRVVTSTVKVRGGVLPVVPVKTAGAIPKKGIFDCMKEINAVNINAPVKAGDVIISDVLGSGVDVVAVRDIDVM